MGVAGSLGLPSREATSDFGVAQVNGESALFRVDGDAIAIFDDGNGTANLGFGCNMADDHPVCAAGETAICDQADRLAVALANEGCGNCQHLAHTWPALWPFIADHGHIPMGDLMLHDSLEGLFLGIKNP